MKFVENFLFQTINSKFMHLLLTKLSMNDHQNTDKLACFNFGPDQ